MKKRPTQADVAREAGVSRSTVSLVLNRNESRIPISEETRERVIVAAKTLGYSPNPIAQMLVQGHTRLIGVFPLEGTIPYNSTDFYYPYLIGIEREAAVKDYNVLLFTRNQSSNNTLSEINPDKLNSLRLADGLILTGSYPDLSLLRWLQKENFPFVLIGRSHIPIDEIDTVVNNHQPTSYEATRHLIEWNHRRLGLIVGDLSLAYHRERLAGCRMAVAETEDVELIIFDARSLTNTATFMNMIKQHGITAVLCADRKLTTLTVDLIQQIPLLIPDDLSIIFLVTNSWDMPFANPTRVNINRDIKGRVAVQRLTERLGGSLSDYQQLEVPCQFVIGNTTVPR